MNHDDVSTYFDRYKQTSMDDALKLACLISSRVANQTIVFLLPTYERAKFAAREFEMLIESIPEWAREEITHKRATEMQFRNGVRVKFVHNALHTKGLSMNAIFIACNVSLDAVEYIAPHAAYGATIMRIV